MGDQEEKVIQIVPFAACGVMKHRLSTFTFVPPKGTAAITPFACFRIRGVWRGATLEWDPQVLNEDMQLFTDLSPDLRRMLAAKEQLDGPSLTQLEQLACPPTP